MSNTRGRVVNSYLLPSRLNVCLDCKEEFKVKNRQTRSAFIAQENLSF